MSSTTFNNQATKNMNPQQAEIFRLTNRVIDLENNTELKNKINSIKIEQDRLNLLMGQFSNTKKTQDRLLKRMYEVEKLEDKPKSLWQRIMRN